MKLDEFRHEWQTLRTGFYMAHELLDATNPGTVNDVGIGPTFEEPIQNHLFLEHLPWQFTIVLTQSVAELSAERFLERLADF